MVKVEPTAGLGSGLCLTVVLLLLNSFDTICHTIHILNYAVKESVMLKTHSCMYQQSQKRDTSLKKILHQYISRSFFTSFLLLILNKSELLILVSHAARNKLSGYVVTFCLSVSPYAEGHQCDY